MPQSVALRIGLAASARHTRRRKVCNSARMAIRLLRTPRRDRSRDCHRESDLLHVVAEAIAKARACASRNFPTNRNPYKTPGRPPRAPTASADRAGFRVEPVEYHLSFHPYERSVQDHRDKWVRVSILCARPGKPLTDSGRNRDFEKMVCNSPRSPRSARLRRTRHLLRCCGPPQPRAPSLTPAADPWAQPAHRRTAHRRTVLPFTVAPLSASSTPKPTHPQRAKPGAR